MAESGHTEAQTTTTTTTTSVTLNVGYPTSWQGVLKIAKTVSTESYPPDMQAKLEP